MISIVTPVLNGARFIEKNIQSIQKLAIPYEHIIVDGGSTDETLDIVAKYPQLKLLHQKEKNGMYGAIDQGFKQAKYDIITWINCDDEIIAGNFERAIHVLYSKNRNFLYAGSYYYISNKNIKVYRKPQLFSIYFAKKGLMPFTQPATIYTRELYNSVGCLNFHSFKLIGDLDLFQRIALSNKLSYISLNIPLTTFLCRDDSLLHSSSRKTVRREEMLLTKKPETAIFIKILFKATLFNYYINYLKELISRYNIISK